MLWRQQSNSVEFHAVGHRSERAVPMSGGIAEASLQSQENKSARRLKPYPFLLNQCRGPLEQDASAPGEQDESER